MILLKNLVREIYFPLQSLPKSLSESISKLSLPITFHAAFPGPGERTWIESLESNLYTAWFYPWFYYYYFKDI